MTKIMTKHSYMFSYSAMDKNGNMEVGRYTFTGEETLHLLADIYGNAIDVDVDAIQALEKEIEKRIAFTDVTVIGITDLPMKVKR